MTGLESSYVNTALNKEGELRINLRDKIVIDKNPYLNFEYLGINLDLVEQTNSVLKYKEFRQALNYAYDFEWINKTLYSNAYTRTNSYFDNSSLASSGLPSIDELKSFNPEQISKIISSNGEVIHENVEMTGPTAGGVTGEEHAEGPLMFQGTHGVAAYRNISFAPVQ